MIGYLGYRAVRGQIRMYRKSRAQKGGPWTFLAVLFTVLPFTVLWLLVSAVQGQLLGSLAAGGVNGILVLLVLLDSGRLTVDRTVSAHAEPAAVPRPADAMRERAAQLRELEAVVAAAETSAADADRAERARRVADLLSVPCPELTCLAPPGTACVLGSGQPPPALVIVQKVPLALCHLLRVKDAVRYGSARYSDIRAQFGNDVPDGVL